MNRSTPVLLAALVLLPALVALASTASAGGSQPVEGCAKLLHIRTGATSGDNTSFRVSTDALGVAAPCTASGPLQLLEGHCITFNIKYARQGALAPLAPSAWQIYWIEGETTQNDHGATGEDNWPAAPLWTNPDSDPNGETVTACATLTGTTAGAPVGGTYRLVLRQCQNACSSTTGVDINSDLNAACACSGAAQTGYTAMGNAARVSAIYNSELRDPLTLGVNSTLVTVGKVVNVTIEARYLNATLRPGAASNITLHFLAPDNTWAVDGANPTEMTFSDGTGMGQYHYSFTPTQTGKYELVARTISSLNERSRSKPLALEVVAAGGAPITYNELVGLIAALATTTQLNDAVAPLATSAGLTSAVAPLATTAQLSAGLATVATSAQVDGLPAATWSHSPRTITGGTVDGDLSQAYFDERWALEFRPHADRLNQTETDAASAARWSAAHATDDIRETNITSATWRDGRSTRDDVENLGQVLVDHGRASNHDHEEAANLTKRLSIGLQSDIDDLQGRADLVQHYAPHAAAALAGALLLVALIARARPPAAGAPRPRQVRP